MSVYDLKVTLSMKSSMEGLICWRFEIPNHRPCVKTVLPLLENTLTFHSGAVTKIILHIDMLSIPIKIKALCLIRLNATRWKSPPTFPTPLIRGHVVTATVGTSIFRDKIMSVLWGKPGFGKPQHTKGKTFIQHQSKNLVVGYMNEMRQRFDCCSPTPLCFSAFLKHDSYV